MKTKKKPLSLYIHIPFCKKKCLYCDFLSAPACYQEREVYVKALLREISHTAELFCGYEVISVFFGGGTPSLLNAGQMKRIMSAIQKGYCLAQDVEITVECNPATADLEKLRAYKESGINRLSIGLQSANDTELKELGRIHTFCQFTDTFLAAREAGFDNINVDIMSALPGQTYESYIHTLDEVTKLNPEHISAYSLIIEEGTPFYARYGEGDESAALPQVLGKTPDRGAQKKDDSPMYPPLPDEDTERRMYYSTQKVLQKAGYYRYEISNYAKKGYECRHNLTYWTGIEYWGFGLGASSYFDGHRYKNCSGMDSYIKESIHMEKSTGKGICSKETQVYSPLHEETIILSSEEKMEEYMFLGLRVTKGVSVCKFKEYFGISMEEIYGKVIDKLKGDGLLLQHGDWLYLSKKGTDVANYVMMHFLLENK